MDRKAIFKEVFESSYTWIEGFMRNVRRCGNSYALCSPATGRRLTYKELNSRVNQLSNALLKNGVGHGDVVMYIFHNCEEFVLCYIAPQKLGAVNSPINYYLSPGEISLNIEDSKPKVLVYEESMEESVKAALQLCSFKPELVISTKKENLPQGHLNFEEFLAQGSEEEPVIDWKLHIYDECTRLYTSGTTNRPKGIPVYIINEVLTAHDIIIHFPLTYGDKTMNMTPWFHRGGVHIGGPCPTLYVGGEVIALREFSAGLTLQYTQEYKINFLIGVPAVLTLLSRVQEQTHADLSSLKGLITMGAPLDKENCIHFMETLTPRLFNGYGTTETFWNTILRPQDLPKYAGSCGRACTDDDVRVVKIYPDRNADPNDLVKRDNKETGEIIISAAAKSSLHYFANEELTNSRFQDGFFYTGDVGVWDEDSFITLLSRKDDMIVSAGENIYPAQVESILLEHPGIEEACVIGLPDELREQVPVAYVVPKEGIELTPKDVAQFVTSNEMLAAYKRPRYYKICDKLPHTPTGKLQRAKVRAQAVTDFAEGLLTRR